jgi:hypothetical protein
VNASAISLAPGTYDTSVTVTNTTNGQGNTTRDATLTIVAPLSRPTTTALTAAPNPSTFGQAVIFTATVTSSGGIPTGTVTFNDGATTLGPGTLASGVATFSTTTLSAGSHAITAVYEGNTDFLTSTSSPLTQSVSLPVFQGVARLLSVTAACSAVSGLSVGGAAESNYRPRLNPSLVLKFTGSTAILFRAAGNDQMRGPGIYTSYWISDRETSTGSGTYNFVITPTPITWETPFVLITGTITNFANIAECNIGFLGSYRSLQR